MIANRDDYEDDYEDDLHDEKRDILLSLIEKTKGLVEPEETKQEKQQRLEATKALYLECSAEVERLSEMMASSELTDEEKVAKGEEIRELEMSSLEREYQILKDSRDVIESRMNERVSDARQDLDKSLRGILADYLLSLDDSHFDSLALALAGKESQAIDYRDLMLGFFEKMAEKEKVHEVIKDLGTLKPFANSRHYWHGFNELFLKPFADIHQDPKTFHRLIALSVKEARAQREEQKSNKRTGWVIIAVVVAVILFFTFKS